jgi:hypothetical protein
MPSYLLDDLLTGGESDLDGALHDRAEQFLNGALNGGPHQLDQHGVGLQEGVLLTHTDFILTHGTNVK